MISPTLILLLLPVVAYALSLQPSAFSAYRSKKQSPYHNRNNFFAVSFSDTTVLSETTSASNEEEEITVLPELLQEEILLDDSISKTEQQFWKWRNHDIFTEVRTPAFISSNSKPKIILLHGFGASTTYWRETMTTLQNEGFEVHALDLLGQGRSSMPFYVQGDGDKKRFPYKLYPKQPSVTTPEIEKCPMLMGKNTNTKVYYAINLWANMIDDYARHCNMDEVILMGNSLGSLVALSAATGDFIESPNNIDRENMFAYLAGNNLGERSRVKGVCLFNCAVGLNSMNILKNTNFSEVQRSVFKWIFGVLNNLIFDNESLLKFALNNVVTKELLRDALKSLYTYNPERVDDELVDSFYYPAKFGGDGAIDAIRQIYCNDPGLSPMELHAKYPEILDKIPLHLLWGDSDVVTPIEGDVGKFYCDRVANNRGGKGMTTIDVVHAGHLLFDDNPSDTNDALLRWLNKKVL
jgi:pimeloyl-ACP methyl ester carboxylesterase